jgi:hypothetical protein
VRCLSTSPSRFAAAALCLSLLGCDALFADCLSIGRPAVTFTLRDASTSAEVTLGGYATLVGATFADSVGIPPGEARYGIGMERDGAMQLAIQVPGYQRWERALVIEREGACDYLQTATLDVRLQRGAGS